MRTARFASTPSHRICEQGGAPRVAAMARDNPSMFALLKMIDSIRTSGGFSVSNATYGSFVATGAASLPKPAISCRKK